MTRAESRAENCAISQSQQRGKTSPGGKSRRAPHVSVQKRKKLQPPHDFNRRDDVIHAQRGQDIWTVAQPTAKSWEIRAFDGHRNICVGFFFFMISCGSSPAWRPPCCSPSERQNKPAAVWSHESPCGGLRKTEHLTIKYLETT